MSVQTRGGGGTCKVLLEDPELAEAVPAPHRERVAEECTVRELRVPCGEWDTTAQAPPETLGVVVMQGLLIRRVGIDGRFGAELLGRGDLLRTCPDDDALTLPLANSWLVHDPVRLAILDERFARLTARYPKLASRLMTRALRRARHLAVNMAIINQARVDVRLHMLFWHLAGRFGRVRGDGVILPLRLTHAVLAELVAARRPTVTSALSALVRDGRLQLLDDAWLLSGEPPGELGPLSLR